MKQLDHRRRLIDSFVNAIYLFDDRLVITFNYKEGTKTMTFAEIEEVFGSDLSLLSVPKRKTVHRAVFLFAIGNRASSSRRECVSILGQQQDEVLLLRQVHRPLLPVPNSRNPNLVPVGDEFGFLVIFTKTY